MERKTVSDYLPMVKANRYTFYNLDKETIELFRREYCYLKKHKDRPVSLMAQSGIDANFKLKNEYDYIKKYNAMVCIGLGIIWS